MKDHVGTTEQGDGWLTPGGVMVAGAYQEDHTDLVFGYGGLWDAYVTCTHFWDPDNGDGSKFHTHPDNSVFENAFYKACRYIYGGYEIQVPYPANGIIEAYEAPAYLPDFYKTGTIYYKGFYSIDGHFTTRGYWTTVSQGFRDRITWDILGRLCHLLADVGTPAHAHYDQHDALFDHTDSYEDWMPSVLSNYTYQTAYARYGFIDNGFIDVVGTSDPLKRLFYITAQLADHYSSDDYAGDNSAGINEPFSLYPPLETLISMAGAVYPTVDKEAVALNAGNYTICATAGLMYWFAVEAGLISHTKVENDFQANQVTVNSTAYPSGKFFSFDIGSPLVISTMDPQSLAGYVRHFWQWEQRDLGNTVVSTYPQSTWSTTIHGNHTYSARFNREFNINLSDIHYIEAGGTGATYKVNGTNTGSTWQGQYVERVSPALNIEAVPQTGWVFAGWSDYTPERFNNPRSYVPDDHNTLFANSKGHNVANPGVYSPNNQRKVAQSSGGVFCQVQSSGGKIWFTRYTSSSPNTPELDISWEGAGIHGYPSIAICGEVANVVWQSIDWTPPFQGGYIRLKRYNITSDTWGPTETIGNFYPDVENYLATPVIAAYNLSADGSADWMNVAWREDTGIRIYSRYFGSAGSGMVQGTNSASYYPSIDMSHYGCALVWEDQGSQTVKYTECNYDPLYNQFSFTNSATISDGSWESNQRPCLAFARTGAGGADDLPTVVWQCYDTFIENGTAIIIRQRSALGPGGTWGPATAFTMSDHQIVAPALGTNASDRDLWVIWTYAGGIYKVQYNGSLWDGPYLIGSGSFGGTEPNINCRATQQLQAVWRRPSGYLTGSRWGANLQKASVSDTCFNAPFVPGFPVEVPRKLNRHAFIDLAQAFNGTGAKGTVGFELAGVGISGSTSAVVPFADLASSVGLTRPLSSQPIRVSETTSGLSVKAAVYGLGLSAPTTKMPISSLARIVIREAVTGKELTSLWEYSFSELQNAKDGAFGCYKDLTLSVGSLSGGTVVVSLEPLTQVKGLEPLVTDNYLLYCKKLQGELARSQIATQEAMMPTIYGFHRAYPNPFNPTTTVVVDLPEDQQITLKLYNVLGQELITVTEGRKPAGRHTYTVNMSSYSSGMYICRLVAGRFIRTQKLLLVK